MIDEKLIRELLHMDLDYFTDEEIQEGRTVQAIVDGKTYILNTWDYDTVEDVLVAIDNESVTREHPFGLLLEESDM